MKNIKNKRFIIQMIFLVSVIIASLNHTLSSIGLSIPFVSESLFHYICPICGVTSIYQFFVSSTLFVVKVKSSLGIIIGAVIMLSVLFGPVICGFICPFGAVQDLVARIGKKIFKNKYNKFVPQNVDKYLKYLRYFTLVATVVLTASSGILLLEKLNPYHAFLGIFKGSVSFVGMLILIIVVVTSLFIQRPWCKYLCPYGAFLGLFNKIKVFRIVRNKSTCISCTRCSKVCPMSIDVDKKEEVRDLSCISCMECVSHKVCPKDNTLSCNSKDLDEINEYLNDENREVNIYEK